jgi:hypothetical protein
MKDFKEDLQKFKFMIENYEPFAISRNNDGEMIILRNEHIDLRKKLNGEFVYNPQIKEHSFFREKLLESARHNGDNYYVGIACRCCVGDQKHEHLKKLTGLDNDHLTWGNIFVNGNFNEYLNTIVPMFSNYDVVMVCNHKANTNLIPFKDKIVKTFRVGTNAWMEDYLVVDELKEYVKESGEGKLYIFAAGPFSNILILEAYKESNKNTYLDVGSTLDSSMGLGKTRGYLNGAATLKKVCIW